MSLLNYWDTQRPAKRRRTFETPVSNGTESQTEIKPPPSPSPSPTVAVGQTPAPDDLEYIPSSQTELETSLPTIKVDEHAIEEYEASKHEAELGLHERLRDGSWQRGKSSIYVDAFNLALETVLGEESHLFNEAEMEIFRQWRELSYESQYLYVRLFLRKTSAWHRINKLNYYSDISDLVSVTEDLQRERRLPDSELGNTFRFADGIEEITTLEEASSLLLLEELKIFAKDAKVQGNSKKELLAALHETSKTQKGLKDTNNRDSHFTQKILDYTGACIRISPVPRVLFERVHLVFYRSTEWTEKSLTTMILAKMSKKNFPEYIVCRSNSIFASREALLEFESAIQTQFAIDNILEFNGPPTTASLQQIIDLADKSYPRWKELVDQEQKKEDSIYESGEGAYLRRFSPAWVLTRIIHKSLHPLGRFKEHKREHEVLEELLSQRLFHAARRGAWYQRKALLEEHYMWVLTPAEGLSEELRRKQWKRIALKTCETGLEDPLCHLIYHYDLQKRITKLEKALRIVKREQHDFGHVMLGKPVERTVEGIRIETGDSPKKGKATVWVDEREGGGECRVETDNMMYPAQFGYLFYDILFTYVPNVFQTAFQTCPLDLHTDVFYPSRASEINHRLVEITNGEAERIIRDIHARHGAAQPCVVGLDWSFDLEDLVEIVRCFRGEALATICKVMAQEYQQRGVGSRICSCGIMRTGRLCLLRLSR
ncbi:hypothetical protein N7535_003181 [Penicillium sp. DV-2018c]|nr:hypothetical protein N7535_003181 [Penicillium sp. DV-2018c]